MSNGNNTGKILLGVGLGCAAIVLVVGVAFFGGCLYVGKKVKDAAQDFEDNPAKAAAELAVRFNPDYEKISSDDEAGTMTVRDTRTGEELTLDFDAISEGRFEVRNSEGEATFSTEPDADGGGLTIRSGGNEVQIGGSASGEGLPDWVPLYPDAELSGTMINRSNDSAEGGFSFGTSDDLDTVVQFFKSHFADNGYELENETSMNSGAGRTVILSGVKEGAKLGLFLSTREEGGAQGNVTFSDGQ